MGIRDFGQWREECGIDYEFINDEEGECEEAKEGGVESEHSGRYSVAHTRCKMSKTKLYSGPEV
jgi:hypothetical protein